MILSLALSEIAADLRLLARQQPALLEHAVRIANIARYLEPFENAGLLMDQRAPGRNTVMERLRDAGFRAP